MFVLGVLSYWFALRVRLIVSFLIIFMFYCFIVACVLILSFLVVVFLLVFTACKENANEKKDNVNTETTTKFDSFGAMISNEGALDSKVMLEKFAYYCLVYPLSLLPLRVLYLMTDLFFLLLITVFPYRKKVIDKNLKLSFPELSDHERKKIKRKFYRHFTDILAEGIKNLSFSKKQYSRRVTVKNNSLMERLYSEGRNVLLVSGHYNNWEWIITAQDMIFRHKAFGIGKRMTSKFWDQKVNQRRNRFGMTVIHRLNQKQILEDLLA